MYKKYDYVIFLTPIKIRILECTLLFIRTRVCTTMSQQVNDVFCVFYNMVKQHGPETMGQLCVAAQNGLFLAEKS